MSELTDEMPIPDYTNLAPGDRLARALLLFYDAGTWNARAQREWKALTGLDDATTKDLGDLARSVIEQGQRYLIWSDEHHGWWKSTRRGYTRSLSEAGRFDRESAVKICARAVYDACLRGHMTDLPVLEADIARTAKMFRDAQPELDPQPWE